MGSVADDFAVTAATPIARAVENRGALQIFARRGVVGINRRAPRFGIFFVGELGDRKFGEIGIA